MPNIHYCNTQQVADFYEVSRDSVKYTLNKHKFEFLDSGMKILEGKRLADFNDYMDKYSDVAIPKPPRRKLTILPKKAILLLGMILKNSVIAKKIRKRLLEDDIVKEVAQKEIDSILNEELKVDNVDNTPIKPLQEEIEVVEKEVEEVLEVVEEDTKEEVKEVNPKDKEEFIVVKQDYRGIKQPSEPINLFVDGVVTTSEGREYSRLVGGFGDDKPMITDIQVAKLLDYKKGARQVREQIERNIKHFEMGMHIEDLNVALDSDNNLELLKSLGYTQMSISKSKNIYALSQAGFLLYLKFADGDKAVELYKDFIEDYFKTKMHNQVMKETLEEELKNFKMKRLWH